MPKFLVCFPHPVIYQPQHLVARREVRELPVQAPSAADALIHAARVVEGDVNGATAHEAV